jgi:glutamate-1-semialdehyde 2,1-aminomutase
LIQILIAFEIFFTLYQCVLIKITLIPKDLNKMQPTEDRYTEKYPKSKILNQRAIKAQPRGASHDGWYLSPFPVYIAKAEGSWEWDVDGNAYVDYFGGHGALILGHSHPSLIEAVTRQVQVGTHYGAVHELQVQWAESIQTIMPSAERVEFTNSGTEANMVAIRLARAFTERKKIVRFEAHFGGFADALMVGYAPPWDIPTSNGILPVEVENTVIIPPNDTEALEKVLAKKDVAIVSIEAAGAFSGVTSLTPAFYTALTELTQAHGTLLHFDEVVTGFRYAPGGVQGAKGLKPDLTSLGKAVAGGVPAGAVIGRADVMEMMNFKDDQWNRYKRVSHTGTFNGNPLSAAAGIASLKILADGIPQEKQIRRLSVCEGVSSRCLMRDA